MSEPLGTITNAECDELVRLTERYSGLTELLLCLDENEAGDRALRCRVEKERDELAETRRRWWIATAERHGWPSRANARWKLDYATRQVTLEDE